MQTKSPALRGRVNVSAPNGRYMFTAHTELAKAMIADGSARRLCSGDRIRAIELTRSLSEFSERDEGRRTEDSRVTTYKKHAVHGQVVYLKEIHVRLAPLYRQVQLDCMSA